MLWVTVMHNCHCEAGNDIILIFYIIHSFILFVVWIVEKGVDGFSWSFELLSRGRLKGKSVIVQWQDPSVFGPLTIVFLLFSIVLSVSMKFSPGGRSPPAWLFQNPRWPPRTYKSMILHNVRSKYSIIALLVLIIMFLMTWSLIVTLIYYLIVICMEKNSKMVAK